MDIQVQARPLQGSVLVPPSKSMAHRAIIAAALAQGQSTIRNIQLSDDIRATIAAMRALGAQIETNESDHGRLTLNIQGLDRQQTIEEREIDAIESGSTLRFMIPIATLVDGKTIFRGRGKLGVRPLDTYADIYADQGLTFDLKSQEPLELHTQGQLSSGTYEMVGNVSSQFITGMLYTLPLLEGNSSIQITTPLESVGYLDMTLDVLQQFGIQIHFDRQANRFEIPGKQAYQAQDYTVEGDYSQAAFFLAAGAIGNEVILQGLTADSDQGDREMLAILEEMGCQIENVDGGIRVKGDNLKADLTIDGSQIPDIIPILSTVCALAPGKTVIKNLERLKIKESDRLEATRRELSSLGANIEVVGDSLHIQGVDGFKGGAETWSHKDHRIAMMLGIASSRCSEPIIIQDAEVVSKSYPNFWQDFEELGGDYHEWNLG